MTVNELIDYLWYYPRDAVVEAFDGTRFTVVEDVSIIKGTVTIHIGEYDGQE